MRVLATVSTALLHSPRDLRVLDGSSLIAHLAAVDGILDCPGASCTQQELTRGARCGAEVLLQVLPRLVEVCCCAGPYQCHGGCWHASVTRLGKQLCMVCIASHILICSAELTHLHAE